jgi:hypothetical protein
LKELKQLLISDSRIPLSPRFAFVSTFSTNPAASAAGVESLDRARAN